MYSLSARHIRACLGALWILDSLLQAQPHFFGYTWWHDNLAESVMGQPKSISLSILWATSQLAHHPAVANGIAVTIQASIGILLLVGRFERAAIAASIPWSLAVWWVGEGFGAIPTGFAVLAGGAPGPVMLYPLIGLLCWPAPSSRQRRRSPVARAAVARCSWLAVWVGGATVGLPWRFGAARMIDANIEQSALGQPAWVSGISHSAYQAVSSHPLGLPTALFVAELAIGAGVLSDRTRAFALVAGVALALLFWMAVQDFGGLAGGAATDPGSGPLLLLLAATVLSGSEIRHPNRPRRRIEAVEFDIDDYKNRTGRLRWEDLDLETFKVRPLDPGALRCVRYMHDVEYHTVCYLRDLLVSPAHSDADITSFLSFWVFEEFWHGEALSAVLTAHGEPSGATRVSNMRRRLGWTERIRPLSMMLGSAVAGDDFVAVHMAWGAVNEWTTQAGYSQLARRSGHPVMSELLRRIMRQEGRHIDFYASQAHRRLAASHRARRLTRLALTRLWSPVGSKLMPVAETSHLAAYLMSGPDGLAAARRIDRRIDRLPGLDGLALLERSITSLGAHQVEGTAIPNAA